MPFQTFSILQNQGIIIERYFPLSLILRWFCNHSERIVNTVLKLNGSCCHPLFIFETHADLGDRQSLWSLITHNESPRKLAGKVRLSLNLQHLVWFVTHTVRSERWSHVSISLKQETIKQIESCNCQLFLRHFKGEHQQEFFSQGEDLKWRGRVGRVGDD